MSCRGMWSFELHKPRKSKTATTCDTCNECLETESPLVELIVEIKRLGHQYLDGQCETSHARNHRQRQVSPGKYCKPAPGTQRFRARLPLGGNPEPAQD